MLTKLKKFETQALEFSVNDRAALAEHLIASLDETDESENERLWLKEADYRYQEYKKGNIPSRTAENVLNEARTMLK